MVHYILQIFIYILFADIILSWFPQYREQNWAQTLHKIADVPQKPIRDILPKGLPIDPTPMIVIIIIQLLMAII